MTTQVPSNDITSTTTDWMPAHARNQDQDAASPGTEDRTLSHGMPSALLLGRLPVARWIPMDVHSMMDYANAAVTGAGALMTDCPEAQIASVALAGADLVVSSLTDYRLSVAKVIPIEVHETIDYVWGIAAIAAPFVFGYWKKAPGVALSHVIAGAGGILASLVTDYRAYRGRAQRLRARNSGEP